MNETELVERCGKGDNLARKQLYERYAGQLMAVCVRYTGDREVAQDVLHDGFLNIFRSFSQFTYKGEGSLKAWLTRIMAVSYTHLCGWLLKLRHGLWEWMTGRGHCRKIWMPMC